MQAIPELIPEMIADRYLAALTELVSVARDAVAADSSPQSSLWQRKLLPLLERQLFAMKSASAHYAIGDQQPLVGQALESRFLARDMDGYPLNFAGEDFAARLKEKRQLVVFAAWRVCQSAGVV